MKPIRTIAVTSGKGGVGKSFVSCNLAYLFSARYKTLVWDADIDFPNLDKCIIIKSIGWTGINFYNLFEIF